MLQLTGQNDRKYVYLEKGIIAATAAAIAFLFLLKSPLHPWVNGRTWTDSSVFKTIALMMDRGAVPYRDTFDHKGPLMYLLNYVGNRISTYRGIWVIEFLFLVGLLCQLYETARLVTNRVQALTAVMVSVSLLFLYFDAGNLVEEYAMLFIALGQYVFTDYFVHHRIGKARLIACGFGCGAILMLRPNMVALWGVMCLFVLFCMIGDKDFSELGKFLIWFLLGALLLIAPILIWLAANHALGPFFEDYILFNKEYSGTTFTDMWKVFFSFADSKAFLLSVAVMVLLFKKDEKDRAFHGAYLIYMFVSLLLLCISGRGYPHYGMVLVPVVTYPIAAAMGAMDRVEKNDTITVIKALMVVYLMGAVVLPDWVGLVQNVPYQYVHRKDEKRYGVSEAIASYISENVEEEETISVYGNWDIIYILSDRKHATKYSYQFPIGQVKPALLEDYYEQLAKEMPKIIVVQGDYNDGRMQAFLTEHNYEQVWEGEEESETEGVPNKGYVYQLSER